MSERIAAALAKLDICKRYAEMEGADGDFAVLAHDYGGMGYENDPAVQAVGNMQALLVKVHAGLKALVDAIGVDHNDEYYVSTAPGNDPVEAATALLEGEFKVFPVGNQLQDTLWCVTVDTLKQGSQFYAVLAPSGDAALQRLEHMVNLDNCIVQPLHEILNGQYKGIALLGTA